MIPIIRISIKSAIIMKSIRNSDYLKIDNIGDYQKIDNKKRLSENRLYGRLS